MSPLRAYSTSGDFTRSVCRITALAVAGRGADDLQVARGEPRAPRAGLQELPSGPFSLRLSQRAIGPAAESRDRRALETYRALGVHVELLAQGDIAANDGAA